MIASTRGARSCGHSFRRRSRVCAREGRPLRQNQAALWLASKRMACPDAMLTPGAGGALCPLRRHLGRKRMACPDAMLTPRAAGRSVPLAGPLGAPFRARPPPAPPAPARNGGFRGPGAGRARRENTWIPAEFAPRAREPGARTPPEPVGQNSPPTDYGAIPGADPARFRQNRPQTRRLAARGPGWSAQESLGGNSFPTDPWGVPRSYAFFTRFGAPGPRIHRVFTCFSKCPPPDAFRRPRGVPRGQGRPRAPE